MLGSDHATLGGVEIVNSARVGSYLANGYRPPRLTSTGRCGCDDGETYDSPASDPAPWYDSSIPESADFAGFLVTSVAGAEDSPWTRNIATRLTGGGTLGRLRARPRVLTYSGVLIGRSCCAVSYGMRWLTAALVSHERCGVACEGATLTVSACCSPGEMSEELAPIEGACAEVSEPGSLWRDLRGVGLLQGPTIVSRSGGSCGRCGASELLEVTFTLAAESPFLFGAAIDLLSEEPFPLPPDDECPVEWVKVGSPGAECDSLTDDPCPPAPLCAEDPGCPGPPDPPEYLVALDPCFCVPLAKTSVCAEAPLSNFGLMFDGVPVIEVFAGSGPLRNVTVDFTSTVFGGCDPDDVLESACDRVARIQIRYVPPGGTLRIDGAVRRVTLTCEGAEPVPGDRNLTSPFTWPDLACDDFCICVSADALTVAEDAWASVSVVPREGVPAVGGP